MHLLNPRHLKCFPYLADVKKATGGGDVPVSGSSGEATSSAQLIYTLQAFEWRIFDQTKPLEILGVRVLPLPVEHGVIFSTPPRPYFCLGFVFDRKIAYLSDVSRIPDDVWSLLEQECQLPDQSSYRDESRAPRQSAEGANGQQIAPNGSSLPRLKALVVDCLRIETFTSHFGLGEAVGTARRLGAERTYLVSVVHHESFFQFG